MSMLNYPGDFDFAYQGYQYPLPPSWNYAIRLEDQINWLLQALLKINDKAVSQSILDAGLADNLEQAKEYTDALYSVLKNKITENYEDLSEQIRAIAAGISQWLSPVCDGNNQYAPYIDQQLFNAARPYAASYGEVDAWGTEKEYTYDQVKTALSSYTQYQLCMYAAVIFAGVLAGIGGAHMSVIYAMSWANNMINGRGIIASSLVILCSWKPQRAYLAAYLFGLAQALQIFFQIHEVPISMYVTLMMPHLFTLVALAIISTSKKPSMPEQLKIIT